MTEQPEKKASYNSLIIFLIIVGFFAAMFYCIHVMNEKNDKQAAEARKNPVGTIQSLTSIITRKNPKENPPIYRMITDVVINGSHYYIPNNPVLVLGDTIYQTDKNSYFSSNSHSWQVIHTLNDSIAKDQIRIIDSSKCP